MGKQLKLAHLDPSRRSETGVLEILGYFIVIIGKRGSGKSTVAMDIMRQLKDDVDLAIAVSETAETTAILDGVIPLGMQYKSVNGEILTRIMAEQERQLKRGRRRNLLLFLDDIAWNKKFMHSEEFKRLVFNGRHLCITVICTLQYAMEIPPAIRMNTDLCITMSERVIHYRKNLYEQYFGMMTMEEFNAVMDKATEGYGCLVMNNRVRSNNLDDVLFCYQVDMDKQTPFRLGRDAYWLVDARCKERREEGACADADSRVRIGERIDSVQIT